MGGEIKPGAICVLWKGSSLARLVRVTRQGVFRDYKNKSYWYTRPYIEIGYPEKRVFEDELTLLENEMEVIAWASK
jgi:hypothetical protein